jgi:heat shock protein HspQ
MSTFEVGTIIHHVRYDYRGVVFDVDTTCRASDDWYLNNRTQPGRDQPWYHVLVDGGYETYVAQSNLEPDPEGQPINHPAVSRIFALFLNGKYHRQSLN